MDTKETSTAPAPTLSQQVDVRNLPLSGEFLAVACNGHASACLKLLLRQERLHRELARERAKLNDCNDRSNLSRLMRRDKEEFPNRFRPLAAGHQARVIDLERELNLVTEALSASMPLTAKALTLPLPPNPTANFAKEQHRPRDAEVAARDTVIQKCRGKGHREICTCIDFELGARDGLATMGLPDSWTRDFEVTTFVAAFDDPRCRNRVASLISKCLAR